MNIDAVEALWIAINVVSMVIALANLMDAVHDWHIVTEADHIVAAKATVRRESVRLVIVGALTALVVPGLSSTQETHLSPFLVVLLVVPVGMAVNSALDRIARRTIARMIEEDEASDLVRIEATIDDTAAKVEDIHQATVENE